MIHLKAFGMFLLIMGGFALYGWLVVITDGWITVGILAALFLIIIIAVCYDIVGGK